MLNIKVIIGSTRDGRFSEKLTPWIQESLKKQSDMQIEILDLRTYNLPFIHSATSPSYVPGPDYGDERINRWGDKIREADGFIIVTPEYNHGYSGVLKNALDVIYKEWAHKPVGFISYGSVGGARAVEQLRQVAVEQHMASTRTAVHIFEHWLLMNEDGSLKDGVLNRYTHSLETMLSQLRWWTEALKEARSKTH